MLRALAEIETGLNDEHAVMAVIRMYEAMITEQLRTNQLAIAENESDMQRAQ